jgi:hypothetical protein
MNQKIRIVLTLTLGLFIVACTSEKENIKDMNDIIPTSERDYDQKDTLNGTDADSLKRYQVRFEALGKQLDSISIYDEDLFPERVGPETTEKIRLVFGDDEVIFAKWTFSDSLRVTNALFNWADCFGPKCNSIRIGEEKNLQRNAFQILANDSVLVYIESTAAIDAKKWDAYFEQLEYELDWNYRLEQSKGGKVRWFNYIDEKKTPLKNKEL